MAAAQDRTGSLALWVMIVVLFCLAVATICGSVLTGDYWILGNFATPAASPRADEAKMPRIQ